MLAPTMLLRLGRIHQNDLLEEARKAKIAEAARAASPRLRVHLLARIGDFLVSTGARPQQQCEPAMRPCREVSLPVH